jgi:two-component system, OmpR family, osmolarity sensor histidine kinase EnvZ
MLARLGLVGRLVLILLVALIMLGLAGIALTLLTRGSESGGGLRFPLPDQAAAIADLLDATPAARRDGVLRAVNSDDLRVTLAKSKPPPPVHSRSFPAAEWLVGQYLESANESRQIEVMLLGAPDSNWIERIVEWSSPRSTSPLRIVMALKSGDWLEIETRGASTQRLFGVPTGFWVGVFGALLSALAIAAIVREAKPLTDLAQAIARFSADAKPAHVPVRGAPDVRALITAVNDMQERIAALLKGRTILLGAVSHDLKTFITRLRLRVENIPDEPQRTKAADDLDGMTALIDNAIAIARQSSSEQTHGPVDLANLLRRDVANRDAARVRVMISPGEYMVLGDQVGLARLIANLIDNAERYAKSCRAGLTAAPNSIEFTVDDDGPGVPTADRLAIFEPFYRLEQSRNRETGGSGLGLAIVKQIADAHDATVTVSTSPLGGARFAVILPRHRAARQSPDVSFSPSAVRPPA